MRLAVRKRTGLFAAFIGALLIAAAAAVGFAQGGPQEGPPGPPPPRGERGPGGPGGPGGPRGPIPFLRDLNLTDAQKAQVKQIVDSFASSTKELHDKLRALGGPDDVLKDGTFDEAAVRSKAQARAAIQVELEVAHARMMSQVYNILTAEQKATLAQRRQEFEQRRQQWEAERAAREQQKQQQQQ